MPKTKWSILIECEAKNLSDFQHQYLKTPCLFEISDYDVIGILRVDEEKGTNDKTN